MEVLSDGSSTLPASTNWTLDEHLLFQRRLRRDGVALMSKDDIICVLLVQACNKVIKLYCLNGMLMYFTEKETNRKAMTWAGNDFKRFADATDKINQPYDEAYISVLFFEDTPYFIEHNELLSSDEVGNMVGFVSGALSKIKNAKI